MSAELTSVDFYAVLEISRGASTQEINAAYKKLALKYHPDKGGDRFLETFRKINEAAEVLRDPQRRRQHDQSLVSEHQPRHGHRKKHRYKAEDDWHNWESTSRPWRNSEMNYNLQNPDDCYIYSYGSSVHMDPYSEDSIAESARMAAEADQWEAEYEARQAQYQAEVEAELDAAAAAEAEAEDEDPSLGDYGTWRSEVFDRDFPPRQATEKEPLVCEDFEGFYSSRGSYSPPIPSQFEPNYGYDSHPRMNEGSSGYNSPPDENFNCTGNSNPTFNTYVKHPSHRQPYGSGSVQQHVTAIGPLAPLCPYFNSKLSDGGNLYNINDLKMELNGMVKCFYADWLLSLNGELGATPSLIDLSNENGCSHVYAWTKEYGVHECPICHFWEPVYVMTCPNCGIKRCACCRF